MLKFFNRSIKRIHRDRVAGLAMQSDIHDHFAQDLVDRLGFFKQQSQIKHVLELGSVLVRGLSACVPTLVSKIEDQSLISDQGCPEECGVECWGDNPVFKG